jgi:hypothetical protein
MVANGGKKFPILWKLKFHCRFHKSLTVDPILRQLYIGHILTAHFCNIRFNIIVFSGPMKSCERGGLVPSHRLASWIKMRPTDHPEYKTIKLHIQKHTPNYDKRICKYRYLTSIFNVHIRSHKLVTNPNSLHLGFSVWHFLPVGMSDWLTGIW